jgi:hypothetical protein
MSHPTLPSKPANAGRTLKIGDREIVDSVGVFTKEELARSAALKTVEGWLKATGAVFSLSLAGATTSGWGPVPCPLCGHKGSQTRGHEPACALRVAYDALTSPEAVAAVIDAAKRTGFYSHSTVRPECPDSVQIYWRDPSSPTGVMHWFGVPAKSFPKGTSCSYGATRGPIAEARGY